MKGSNILMMKIKKKLNIINVSDSLNYVVCGMKYRGEVLIVDFGVDEGVEEDKFYVVLNDGEIVEVVE
jgi:hypothetical protein